MILTYKIKHHQDFTEELAKAKQVACFAVLSKNQSSASVKHIGLKSVISCQILRKYARNRKIKAVHNVNLIVPNQGIQLNQNKIWISCLKLELEHHIPVQFSKINQIELDKEYAYVSVTVQEKSQIIPTSWVGVDRNTTGHCAVMGNPTTGKILKLGKKAHHIHKKYKNIRRNLQKLGKLRKVKQIKDRESRIVRDLNHKISRKVVNYALANNSGIVLEDLSGIRGSRKRSKSFKYSLNSWSYYQLEQFINYKAKLLGVSVVKIDPRYTSQQCSRCGLLGQRKGKKFSCSCGHVEDADVNAAFVIALRHQGILQLPEDRDLGKGNTDIPKEATT